MSYGLKKPKSFWKHKKLICWSLNIFLSAFRYLFKFYFCFCFFFNSFVYFLCINSLVLVNSLSIVWRDSWAFVYQTRKTYFSVQFNKLIWSLLIHVLIWNLIILLDIKKETSIDPIYDFFALSLYKWIYDKWYLVFQNDKITCD